MPLRNAIFSAALLIALCHGVEGMRKRRSRKSEPIVAGLSTSAKSGSEFRGKFRDFDLWVDKDSKLGRAQLMNGSDAGLWVVEFESGRLMAYERVRASIRGLKMVMKKGLSLVLQGNVPKRLGYDACGGEADKRVISVADHEVLEGKMPDELVRKYKAEAETADPRIVSLLKQVSRSGIVEGISKLQSFHTRRSESGDKGLVPAVDWASALLQRYGFTVTHDEYRSGFAAQIVADWRGEEEPEKIVVVGAHMDSTAGFLSFAKWTRSPGADDNGSGSAQVLELARLISEGARFKQTIRLCLFTGEEQGLYGSRALATRWRNENASITAMFNLDMMGYKPAGEPITLAYMERKGDANLIAVSKAAVATYVPGLPVGSTAGCCSDQQSFEENGFPACGFFETPGPSVRYPKYHTQTDLLENLSPEQLELLAKGAYASVAVVAGIV